MAEANRLEITRSAIGPGSGLPLPAAPPRAGWGRKLLLSIGGLMVALFLLEIGFRVHDWLRLGMPFFWDSANMAKRRTQISNPFLLFRDDETDLRTRVKTPEQVIEPGGKKLLRIVCLGGSTTLDATAFKEERITYPTELQRILNERLGPDSDVVVEVINAGFASHSSLHALVFLQTEVLPLKPDLVIMYESINDLLVNYFPGPTTPAYANCFKHPYFMPPELCPTTEATLLEHSRVYTWARDGVRRGVWYRIKYRDPEDKVELVHTEQFRTNLGNIAAVCKVNGVRVAFGQQAFMLDRMLFERHFKSKSFNTVIAYPEPGQMHEHFLAYLRVVREVAEAEGVPCADPYGVLKDRKELFADDVHLHAEGARLVGREFARCLVESGLFEELLSAKRKAARTVAAAAVEE